MFKKIFNRIKINFKQSPSERRAEGIYKNYHKRIEKYFNNIKFFSKTGNLKNRKGKI